MTRSENTPNQSHRAPRVSSTSQAVSTRLGLAAIILVFAGYFTIYTSRCSANVVWQAWFAHVPMIEKYFAGTFHLTDAVQLFGEHGLFGYNLLMLLNVKYFQLNALFDSYLNAAIVAFIGALVAIEYARGMQTAEVRPWRIVSFFLPVAVVLFSATQQSSGGMETQVRLGTICLLFTSWLIDRTMRAQSSPNKWHAFLGVIAIFVSVLIFGTIYTFAWYPALVLFCVFMMYHRADTRPYGGLIISALLLSVIAYVKFYNLHPQIKEGQNSVHGTIAYLGFAAKYFCAYFGSSSLGRTLWEDKVITNEAIILLNGAFIVCVYLFASWLSFRVRMIRITTLPLMMMACSLMVGILVLVGRGFAPGFGWMWGANYWYAVHTKFGLAGCLWIFSYALVYDPKPSEEIASIRTIPRVLAGTSIIIILSCLMVSNFYDWRRAPLVKQYFEGIALYGLSPLSEMPVDQNGNTPFIASLADTRYALSVLRAHKLAFYAHEQSIVSYDRAVLAHGVASSDVRLGHGWHGIEGDNRWISGRCSVEFLSGSKGFVMIEGYLPAFLAPNVMSCYVDGEQVATQALNEGLFSVVAHIPANRPVLLTLVVSKPVIPREIGLGNDVRELGAIISNITVD